MSDFAIGPTRFAPVFTVILVVAGLNCSGQRSGGRAGGNGGDTSSSSGGAGGGMGGAGGTEGRICQRSGRFLAIGGDGACPATTPLSAMLPDMVYFEGISRTAYSGDLPICGPSPTDGGNSLFRLRVDKVDLSSRVVNGVTVFDSLLVGANLDASPVCGTALEFNSVSERPSVAPGSVLRVAWRQVARADQDVTGANALFDDDGRLIYTMVILDHADMFDADLGDLFPMLKLDVSKNVICRVPDMDIPLISIRLSTGADVCDIDSHSERCCVLWGQVYEVQTMGATAPRAANPYAGATFTLRKPGFFVSAR